MNLMRADFLAWWWRRAMRVGTAAVVLVFVAVLIIIASLGNNGELSDTLNATAKVIGVAGVFLCAFLGASFVGVERNTKYLTARATWEPRRVRFLAAKLVTIACCSALTVAILVIATAFTAAIALVVQGEPLGLDAAFTSEIGSAIGRAILAGALAGVLGGAWTMLTGSTGSTVVVIALLVIVVDPLLPLISVRLRGIGPITALGDLALPGGIAGIGDETSVGLAATRVAVWLGVSIALAMIRFAREEIR